jgi:hypothetical protein
VLLAVPCPFPWRAERWAWGTRFLAFTPCGLDPAATSNILAASVPAALGLGKK